MTRHQEHMKKKHFFHVLLLRLVLSITITFYKFPFFMPLWKMIIVNIIFIYFCFSRSVGKTFLYRLTETNNTTDSGSLLVQLYVQRELL